MLFSGQCVCYSYYYAELCAFTVIILAHCVHSSSHSSKATIPTHDCKWMSLHMTKRKECKHQENNLDHNTYLDIL